MSPLEVLMERTDAKQVVSPVLAALRRCWRTLQTPPVPDYQPGPDLDPQQERIRQYERVIDLLERTRTRVAERGWTGGAWFSVPAAGGNGRRAVNVSEARALLRADPAGLDSGCLVGTMLALASDLDTAHTIDDVWQATDELYESLHERMGHRPMVAGHVHPPATRHLRLQALTGWNDEPQRSRGDVLDLLNRGIARSIVAACR